jgi:hypothetical protein
MKAGAQKIAFKRIADAALGSADLIVQRWLPSGKREGHEWTSVNPTRGDRRRGSFRINLKTGAWADFATSDKGGDLISLGAYLHGISQGEAAKRIATMLAIESHE